MNVGLVFLNPSSLVDLCVETICDVINREFVEPARNSTLTCYVCFKNNVFIPEPLAEKLLTTFCINGTLNSITSPMFDSKNTRLKYLKISNASKLDFIDLKILCQHNLRAFQMRKLTVPTNEVVALMNQWTRDNLEVLNVSEGCVAESYQNIRRNSVNLSNLKNLRELDVSHTEFHSHNLVAVVEDLPNLNSLNISYTRVDCLAPLKKCTQRLRKLGIANLQITPMSQAFPFRAEGPSDIVFNLTQLEHLDVSFERSVLPFDTLTNPDERHIFKIIEAVDKLPNLLSLDVSGQEDIGETALLSFLETHTRMQFLGLVLSNMCNSKFFDPSDSRYRSHLKVTGTGYLEQVILALRLYKNRKKYIQHCLYSLYTFSEHDKLGLRPDIIELVINHMKTHRLVFPIQLACTACLYNLTKCGSYDNYNSGYIPQKLLAEVVSLTLDAMGSFPAHFQLQKNALLTLCSDKILQETPMDRFRCVRLVLNTFCQFSNEQTERLCVAISSIVASKISSKETAEIGSDERYMKKLLLIVKRKTRNVAVDSTLGFTLSTLWNLSDESPSTCKVFLALGGLNLFIEMLEKYKTVECVLTKILGLLNNIAEVEELRNALMSKEIIHPIRFLLRSSSIEISYFAGGVFAHLVSSGDDNWSLEEVPRRLILEELETAILSWEQANKEMVAYRSFKPFLPLLQCHETHQAQLWALWAIQHVLTAHGPRYSEMFNSEGICVILNELSLRYETNKLVRSRARVILEQLPDFREKKITTFKF